MEKDLSYQRISQFGWLITWTASDAVDGVAPTYYVYVNGQEITRMSATEVQIGVPGGQFPEIAVFDDPDDRPRFYPDFVILQWRHDPASVATRYKIEHDPGTGAWSTLAMLDAEPGYMQYRTGPLTDDVSHNFRTTPISAGGVAGTPAVDTVLVVTRPPVPRATYSYDPATSLLTVSVA